jgi:RecB family exonuclease
MTGEKDAIGTADAIVVRGDELIVIDLKTGRNKVEAFCNKQLTIYALAALKALADGKLTNPVVPDAGNTPPPVDDGDDLC